MQTVSFFTSFKCTIPSGTNVSNTIDANMFHDAASIGILSPATLDALTFTIEVNEKDDGSGTWRTLVDAAGTNIGPPAAGKARQYLELISFASWRIKASGNVSDNRVFDVVKQWTT